MGWEWGETKRELCPCGAGVVVTEDGSDDWGGSKTRMRIVCERCRDEYKVDEQQNDYERERKKAGPKLTLKKKKP